MPTPGPSNEQREFRCSHCNGKILIPRDLPPTTGPCPHCKQSITSPAPEKPEPVRIAAQVPVPAVVREVPVPAAPQPAPAVPSHPAPREEPVAAPSVPPSGTPRQPVQQESKPAAVTAAVQVSEAPAAPAAAAPVPEPPEIPVARESKAAAPEAPKRPVREKAVREKPAGHRKALLVPVVVALLLILAAGGISVFLPKFLERGANSPSLPVVAESRARAVDWQEEARGVLQHFLAAQTSSGKAAWSLRSAELLPEMEAFYGGAKIDDSDTPAAAFSAVELSPEDTARGIYMMLYDLPPQFELREFFMPLAPLEVQYGLEQADLLLASMARVSNFESEPLKVHAFFKRTPDGLRLDWEMFVQTKYRTFRNFIEIPEAGRSRIFRVFILEDVPERGRAPAGTRTYRVVDPAHTGDLVRVNVPVDSELGRALSILNWRGIKDARPKTRTATVELEWSREETPRISLKRFICWEFLGIGGQAVETGR